MKKINLMRETVKCLEENHHKLSNRSLDYFTGLLDGIYHIWEREQPEKTTLDQKLNEWGKCYEYLIEWYLENKTYNI